MQIAQFVWGASFAAAHLFVQYDMPISTPYQVASTVKAAISSASSAASTATSTVSKAIESPAAFGSFVPLVKKLLLRAAGEEGIAELVTDKQGHLVNPNIEEKIERFEDSARTVYETRWHTEWTKVNCIDTTGQAFAIYLNLLYLLPLTFLFGRFFLKAYTQRSKPRTLSGGARKTVDVGKEASIKTKEYIERKGAETEEDLLKDTENFREQLRQDVQAVKDGTWSLDRKVSDHKHSVERQISSTTEKVKEKGKKIVNESSSSTRKFESSQSSESAQVSSTTRFEAADQSEEKQEENIEASQATRPGIGAKEDEEDTDAMGKSGAFVSSNEAEGGGLLPASP